MIFNINNSMSIDRIDHYNFGNGWYTLDWEREENIAQFLFGEEPKREPETVYEEYARILDQYNNLVLPMSGGIDSETAAEVCVREGIPFTPVLMKLDIKGRTMNSHDLIYAEDFLSKHGIKPTYLNLDVENFLYGSLTRTYARNYYCRSPQLATHIWLTDKVGGSVAFVGDFLSIVNYKPGINAWKYFCYDFYLHRHQQPGVAKILSETPEIAAASFKLQLEALKNNTKYENSYDKKCKLYKQAGFHAEPREKKYTGFENILKYYQEKYNGEHLYDKFNEKHRQPLEMYADMPDQIHVWFCEYFEDLINQYRR